MSDVERWKHPRDAAAEAVVYALIEDVAKERKEEARNWVAEHLRRESSKGVEAVANGKVIGSVTRSKDSTKLDVNDHAAFLEYAISHQPHLITVDWRAKEAFIKTLKQVDEQWIDRDGVIVPGVWERPSRGSVSVRKDAEGFDIVRELLGVDRVLAGLREIEQ